MYIAKNPPSAPPNTDSNINVDSGTRYLFFLAKCLSIPKSKNVPMLIDRI